MECFRSVESFLKLLEEKRDCLEIPEVLISSVGTKIYKNENGRWPEDSKWTQKLNVDWNVEHVRNAAESAIKIIGSENMHFR